MLTIEEKTMIETTIKEYIRIYQLNPSLEALLIRNIEKRIELYEGESFSLMDETKIIKRGDSLAYFFLNRFLNNIRNCNIESELNLDGGKGEYINSKQELNLHSFASIQQVTKNKLQDRFLPDSETLKKATLKVFDHEVGHALQTSFTGTIGYNDTKFIELLNALHTNSPSLFNSYQELSLAPLQMTKKGMDVVRKKDKYEQARAFYAPNSYTTYLDEIFNEDEALHVSDIKSAQFHYPYDSDTSRAVYNYESSNYRITPYASMMKILIGKKHTFEVMYGDSVKLYAYFDNFTKEAQTFFSSDKRNVPPMYVVLEKLHLIKSGKNLNEVKENCFELDLFFTKCLETKINKFLANPQLSEKQLEELLDMVNLFEQNLMQSNKRLPANQIIDFIKDQLNQRLVNTDETILDLLDELDDEKQVVKSPQESNADLYQVYSNILEGMYQARLIDDIVHYQEKLNELNICESKIDKVDASVFVKDFFVMQFDEKIQFLLFQMKKAVFSGELDDYLYYQANFRSVLENITLEEGQKLQ